MQTAARTNPETSLSAADEARKLRIERLARATVDEMVQALGAIGGTPDAVNLRGPETGLVMIRGRMGGTGSLFNLGEATVTRATVRLASGAVGHGQRLGGDKHAARLSAILDALGEMPAHRTAVETLCAAVAVRIEMEDGKRAAETAATRVDFFTMVRGDD
ncbi:phosphonate C-P lyase system protein PhnG [Rhizobium sp. C4]|uniref:phosphonate C-P lyase system protein PhnG n=1 Tax=Rhizobium sp. C4 TaxID=1349800 RepID=UPI001E508AC4|nr:phosphonate C-P lyase system protein PhnG [Rhizobium sp. C4]MCD2173492.1 phosphonate C-P lyase system protein PhnG [Rhizobium sp. C4]